MQLDHSKKVYSSVSWFDQIDSTNLELRRQIALEPKEFSAVIAGMQTKGQGRLGRAWSSPEGASLSLSIATSKLSAHPGWLSLIAALAVNRVLRANNLESGIKWPNDVLVDSKKICGILSSIEPSSMAIIGIGLNLGPQDPELGATSLSELGVSMSADQAAALIGAELKGLLAQFSDDSAKVRAEYSKASITLGQLVRAELPGGSELVGTASEIAESGELVILTPEPTLLSAGDVWHLRKQ